MFNVKGDRPQWMVVHERIAGMEIGEVVKDSDLAALLPEASAATIRSAFTRAMREMEDQASRSFMRVRLVGYRMVHADEHAGLARRHHKRAGRQLRSAWRKAHSSDRSLLTQEGRRRMDDLELNLARQREMAERLEGRLRQETRERKSDVAMVGEQVDNLTRLLARHGITDNESTKELAS